MDAFNFFYIFLINSNTSAAWPSIFTPRNSFTSSPSLLNTNVDLPTPPNNFLESFSLNISLTLPSSSLKSKNGKSNLSLNFAWDFKLSLLIPSISVLLSLN